MSDPATTVSKYTNQQIYIAGISLSIIVLALAYISWGQTSAWHLANVSVYRLFPLFGLWAFSLLWAQYIMLAVLYWLKFPVANVQRYFTYSSYGVLVCILSHPSLLIGQLWHDGFGLPPGSYEHFVGADKEWLVILGTLSLFVFLAYELHRWFKDRSWWRFVFYASDVAMLAIFYHGLRLGDELPNGWYRCVWYLYGVLLVAALVYIRTRKQRQP
jgi:hypothetical protein